MELTDEQLMRYSRQIFLPEIDVQGQTNLMNSSVLIIGAGGLGSITAPLLCAAGVGHITLVDDDEVELSNLPRQLAYKESDVGLSKVASLAKRLKEINSNCQVEEIHKRLSGDELINVIKKHDLILDGTDNFESRHIHNKACFEAKKPLLTAAVSQFSGQLSLFDFAENAPCYDCLYSDTQGEENNCAQNGVLGAAASMVASMQALEATKWLAMMESQVLNKLLFVDMNRLVWNKANILVDPECSTCS